MRTKLLMMLVVMILLKPTMTEASPACAPPKQNEDGGSVYSFIINGSQGCEAYTWKLNGITVANEQTFNKTLVKTRGCSYIAFHSCVKDVTFACNTPIKENLSCGDWCPPKSEKVSRDGNATPKGSALSVHAITVNSIIGVICVMFIITAIVGGCL